MLQNRGAALVADMNVSMDQRILAIENKVNAAALTVEQKANQLVGSTSKQISAGLCFGFISWKAILLTSSGVIMLVKFLFKQEYIKEPQTRGGKNIINRAKDVFIIALIAIMAYIKWDDIVRGMKGAATYIRRRTRESQSIMKILSVFGVEPSPELEADLESFEEIAEGMSSTAGEDMCLSVELTCSMCDQVENWVDAADHWKIHIDANHTDRKIPLYFAEESQQVYWKDYVVPARWNAHRKVGLKDREYIYERVMDYDGCSNIDIIPGTKDHSVAKRRTEEEQAIHPPHDVKDGGEYEEDSFETKVGVVFHELMRDRAEGSAHMIYHDIKGPVREYIGEYDPNVEFAFGELKKWECVVCRYTATSEMEWNLHQTVALAMHRRKYTIEDRIWCNICNRTLGSTGNISAHLMGGDHMRKKIWVGAHMKELQSLPSFADVRTAVSTVTASQVAQGTVVVTSLSLFLLATYLLICALLRNKKEPEGKNNKGQKFTRKSLDLVRSYANNFFSKTADADEFFYQVGSKTWRGSKEEREKMQREWMEEFEKFFDKYIEDSTAAQVENPHSALDRNGRTEIDRIYDHLRLRADKKVDDGSNWIVLGRGKKGETLLSVGHQGETRWRTDKLKPSETFPLIGTLTASLVGGFGSELGRMTARTIIGSAKKDKRHKDGECIHINCPKKVPTSSGDNCNKCCGGHHCTHFRDCLPKSAESKRKFCTASLFKRKCDQKCGNIHDDVKAREWAKSRKCDRPRCQPVPLKDCVWGHPKFKPKEEKKERKQELKEPTKTGETLSGRKMWHNLSTITKALKSVGIVRYLGQDQSNCHISRNAIHFGYHPARYILDEKTDVEFVFLNNDREIKIPCDWKRVKTEASDDTSVVLRFDCQSELMKNSLVGLNASNDVPTIGTQVFMISRIHNVGREDHVGDGAVTAHGPESDKGFPEFIQYDIPSVPGHCYSPICIYAGETVKVVAVHSAGDLPGKGKYNQGVAVANFQ
jgi:hypothetical protein